jgi:lysophospholipase L1-like esterase
VKILGDSHLKGSSTRINQYLNTKFEISSLIKPGACINQLVLSQENELNCLGKNDAIVINGGTNDIDNPNCKENEIIASMIQFVLKYNNTNILIVNMPYRHDLANTSKTNLCIQTYNSKLKNIFKAFK